MASKRKKQCERNLGLEYPNQGGNVAKGKRGEVAEVPKVNERSFKYDRMSEKDVPEVLRTFITKNVHSVEQVEVLLLLFSEPDREWDSDMVCRLLRSGEKSVQLRLRDLHGRGFLKRRKTDKAMFYRYTPNPVFHGNVEMLAKFYASHRGRIIALIYSAPVDAIRILGDAFWTRRTYDDD